MTNKIHRYLRILAAVLSVITLLSLVSCGDSTEPPTEAEKQSDELPRTEDSSKAEVEGESEAEDKTDIPDSEITTLDDGKLRVLITSDVHHSNSKTWYGVTSDRRMKLWVSSIKKEHERMPIDLIIIAGDLSLDHNANEGSYTTQGISMTDRFIKNYVSQLPPEIPVYMMPGNHEQYNNTQWKQLTGNDRQFSVEMQGNLFICLDNFNDELEPNRNGNPSYTPSDVSFIRSEMAKYPDDNVWLIGHWFERDSKETAEFKELVKTENRIKGLFAAHQHRCEIIDAGEKFGNKKIAMTGNFSYTYYDAYPTGNKNPAAGDFAQDVKNVTDSFWGFRELVITDQSAYSEYILADTEDVKPSYKESYALQAVIITNERRTIHRIEYGMSR